MDKRGKTPLMLLGLYAMLILALLVLAIAGARLYGSALEQQERNDRERSALAYIQTQAAACRGSITVAPGPQGDALVLTDGDYCTTIYVFDGCLRARFGEAGAAFRPEEGEILCPMEQFRAEARSGAVIISTDAGAAVVQRFGGEADA